MNARLRTVLSTGAAGLFVLGVTLACKGGGSSATSTKPQEPASSLATSKKDYAGDWEGGGVTLHIGDDDVNYEKKTGGTSTKYEGKLDHFDGDDIVIKILIANATLNVQSPPAEVGGEWKMTVEGTEVTRKGGSGGSGPSGKVETSIQSTMAGKGVALKKVSCPAVKPPFDCTVETGLGDTLTAHCVLSGTDIDWAINAAVLDGHKLEGLINSTFLEQEKKVVDAQCPPGNLLKAVGSTFTCDAVDKKGTKSTVNVLVEDKTGKVKISSK